MTRDPYTVAIPPAPSESLAGSFWHPTLFNQKSITFLGRQLLIAGRPVMEFLNAVTAPYLRNGSRRAIEAALNSGRSTVRMLKYQQPSNPQTSSQQHQQ